MNLFTVLGIIFIVLKLCGVILWSWWLVLLPFYGGYAVVCLFLLISSLSAVAWSGSSTKSRNGKRWKI